MNRLASVAVIAFLALVAAGCPQGGPRPMRASTVPDRYAPPAFSPAPAVAEPAPRPFCPVPTMPSEAPPPVWKPVAGRVVILDAGHGGHDDGAAHHGLREKDVNLDVVLRTAAWLRAQGVTVRMTRDRDVFVPLPERSKMANRNPNALFVSIHSNAAAGGPNPFGVETFVLTSSFSDEERCRTALSRYNVPGNSREESRKTLRELTIRCRAQGPELATSIQRSLVRRLGEPDRGVKRADLAVLRETFFCPAVLVEIGFMSHPPTARKMVTPAWRDQAAAAIGEGIVDYMRRIG